MAVLYHVVDVETSGLSPKEHEICELAILTCSGTQIIEIFSQHYSIQTITEGAQRKNGYSVEKLAGWPSFKDPENIKLVHSIIKYPIFAHNANFDAQFLFDTGALPNSHLVRDTLKYCKEDLTKLENNKLDTWLTHFKIKIQNHSALGDAFGLYRLIILKGWQIRSYDN